MAQVATADNEYHSSGIKHCAIEGRFLPNAGSQPTNVQGSTVWGRGFIVTRTSAGVWRVTILRPFADFVTVVPAMVQNDLVVRTLSVTALVKPTASAQGYFEITNNVAGTATDLTGAAGLHVAFTATVANGKFPGAGV